MTFTDDEPDNPGWPLWYHRSGMFCEGHTFQIRDWFGHRSRSEPVNALTNIPYIIFALIAFIMSQRADGMVKAQAALLMALGIGSTAYHLTSFYGLGLMDGQPLIIMLPFYALSFIDHLTLTLFTSRVPSSSTTSAVMAAASAPTAHLISIRSSDQQVSSSNKQKYATMTTGWSGFHGVDMNRNQIIAMVLSWSSIIFTVIWALQQNAVGDAGLHTYEVLIIVVALNFVSAALIFIISYCTKTTNAATRTQGVINGANVHPNNDVNHKRYPRPRMIQGSSRAIRDLAQCFIRSAICMTIAFGLHMMDEEACTTTTVWIFGHGWWHIFSSYAAHCVICMTSWFRCSREAHQTPVFSWWGPCGTGWRIIPMVHWQWRPEYVKWLQHASINLNLDYEDDGDDDDTSERGSSYDGGNHSSHSHGGGAGGDQSPILNGMMRRESDASNGSYSSHSGHRGAVMAVLAPEQHATNEELHYDDAVPAAIAVAVPSSSKTGGKGRSSRTSNTVTPAPAPVPPLVLPAATPSAATTATTTATVIVVDDDDHTRCNSNIPYGQLSS